MPSKKKITSSNVKSQAKKILQLEERLVEFTGKEYTVEYCYLGFRVRQEERGNSKQTISFYDRFYKKYCKFLATMKTNEKECPINILTTEGMQLFFIMSLGDVNQQTKNSYLRGYRAFGRFCEEEGYISGFKCSIKETEPPVKQVYTESELNKLLIKPNPSCFTEFRNYTIINVLLATGARCNTIINLRICDVDLEDNTITFNTTKSGRVAIIGLSKKAKIALYEYISLWRTNDTNEDDWLFCNEYGEQITRNGLNKAIASYNRRRGVEKTSLHLFRHTFAKNWITSGGDIITLSKVLTHSELDMVKKYANLYGQDITAEIEEHSALSRLRTSSGKTLNNKEE